jgi:serine/threonine protein kinase
MDDHPPELVQSEIEPILIPATNIVRDSKFPTSSRGFGDIWKCSMATPSGTQRLVAVRSIKALFVADAMILKAIGKKIRRKAYVWVQLKHNHILPLEGMIVAGEFGPLPALVSPWMEEGSLVHYLERKFPGMSEPRKRELIWQVAAGVSYLHGKDIVHGNLTTINILIDSSGCLRVADFGLSMILPKDEFSTGFRYPGNIRWVPPEAFGFRDEEDEEEGDQKPTKAWDVYSYGCIVFQIFSGNQPYAWIQRDFDVMIANFQGRVPFKPEVIQSYEVYEQFSPCLNKIPFNRPTMDDIMRVLES